MLTIFTILKPSCSKRIEEVQNQSIESWKRIKEKNQILLFSSDLKMNEYGTPYLNDAFLTACSKSQNNILMYTNADIIFTSDILPIITCVSDLFSKFLIVGCRTDISNVIIDFENPKWEERLHKMAVTNGKQHSATGIDYFIFTKEMVRAINMPSFVVGRPAWDNWLIARCRELKYPVIDATGYILALHQNHDYCHLKDGIKEMRNGKEASHNITLAGDRLQKITDADYCVEDLL